MGARSSQSRGPGLNKSDGHLLEYFRQTFGAGGGADSGPTAVPDVPMSATGGTTNDYTESGILQVQDVHAGKTVKAKEHIEIDIDGHYVIDV